VIGTGHARALPGAALSGPATPNGFNLLNLTV